MDTLFNLLEEAGRALLSLFALPYLYLAVALVWWHARQTVAQQRKLYHVRLYGSLTLTLRRLAAGCAAGLAVSLVSFFVGVRLDGETLLALWIVMGALALIRLRFACFAYAAGALGLLQAALSRLELDAVADWPGDALRSLAGIDTAGLLLIAGLAHVAEGLLVRWQGAKAASPIYLEGKRGKPIGAYSLSGLWPLPLVLLVPGGVALPWPTLADAAADSSGWGLLAFPVLLGFSGRTAAEWPEDDARRSGGALMLSGAIVAALAAGAYGWPPAAIAAAAASLALHDSVALWRRWREQGRPPRYVNDGRGVTILAVLPGTPAAEMGLQAGERIRRVNGAAVQDTASLHAALTLQSAFCKLEVVNREGHVKFAQRARYAGEHHQLGLVLAPDDAVTRVAAPGSSSLWQGLQDAGVRLRGAAAAERAAALAAAEAEAAIAETAVGRLAAALAEEDAAAESVPAEPETDPGLPPRSARRS